MQTIASGKSPVEDDGQESRKSIMTDERPCNEDSDVVGTAATSETGRVFEDADSTSVSARAQLRAQTPVNNPYLRKPSTPAPVMVPAPVPIPAPVLNNISVAAKAQTGRPVFSGIGLSKKRGRPPGSTDSTQLWWTRDQAMKAMMWELWQDRIEVRVELRYMTIKLGYIYHDVRKYTYKFEKESLSSRTGIVLGWVQMWE
jgi:hypothetical protein